MNERKTFGTFGYKSTRKRNTGSRTPRVFPCFARGAREDDRNSERWIASFLAMTKNMPKLELINLAEHARNPDYYDKSRDMETAIAWNAVKKTLTELGREELFGYIKSVKLTEKNIVISTGKPVANAELKIYREQLLESVNE